MKINKMTNELKYYQCSCGQIYYSDHGTPSGISWTDGHRCIPIEVKEWLREKMK